jgi:hypothetical protein
MPKVPRGAGFLRLSALCAATSVLVTVHPQMLDVASMSQFLLMTSDLLSVVREAGGDLSFDFFRYFQIEPLSDFDRNTVGPGFGPFHFNAPVDAVAYIIKAHSGLVF